MNVPGLLHGALRFSDHPRARVLSIETAQAESYPGVVAVVTAALLTLIRRWTTNQDRLRRAAGDLQRLKELAGAVKRAFDPAGVFNWALVTPWLGAGTLTRGSGGREG